MIGLIQRVLRADVSVAGETVGKIGPGLLALVCAEKGDTPDTAARLLAKMLGYRVYGDARDCGDRYVDALNRPSGRLASLAVARTIPWSLYLESILHAA